MQQLIYQIKTRNFEPAKLTSAESSLFFMGALVVPMALLLTGVYFLGGVLASGTKTQSARVSTPVAISTKASASVALPASLPAAPVALKFERELSYSVLFLNGKSKLGPAARESAKMIAAKVGENESVDLSGYAGVNAAKDKNFQLRVATARAVSMKMQLAENGVAPSKIFVLDPSAYLFTQDLPDDPKTVKAEIWGKDSNKAKNRPALASEQSIKQARPE